MSLVDPPALPNIASIPLSFVVQCFEKEYNDLQKELEVLEKKISSQDKTSDSPTNDTELQQLLSLLTTENTERVKSEQRLSEYLKLHSTCNGELSGMKSKTTLLENRKREVEVNVKKAQAQNDYLNQIMSAVTADAYALRVQADLRRRSAVSHICPTPSYLRDSFVPEPMIFHCTRSLLLALPPAVARSHRLCFLRRLPYCLPCSLQLPAHSGYWFHPPWLLEESDQFELLIETKDNEWIYFGRYSSMSMRGYDMGLSEWIALDESTKQEYCRRMASEELDGAPSDKFIADMRRRLDSYELAIPCYVLKCYGFNMELYNNLHAAAKAAKPSDPSLIAAPSQSIATKPSESTVTQLQNVPPLLLNSYTKEIQPSEVDDAAAAPRMVLKNIQA